MKDIWAYGAAVRVGEWAGRAYVVARYAGRQTALVQIVDRVKFTVCSYIPSLNFRFICAEDVKWLASEHVDG
jgi:hypothetical protein